MLTIKKINVYFIGEHGHKDQTGTFRPIEGTVIRCEPKEVKERSHELMKMGLGDIKSKNYILEVTTTKGQYFFTENI